MEKQVTRIIEEATGHYISDDSLAYADCRGIGYRSRREAMGMAQHYGYTHYRQDSGRIVKFRSR